MFPINIGVDFGTSYSKICVRGPRSVGVEVCKFGDNLPADALIPSKIWVDDQGVVTLPEVGKAEPTGALVEYPKMALADLEELKISGASSGLRVEIERSIEPLCALFVAHLLRLAKAWVRTNWGAFVDGTEVEWSANVGVPVAHLNSDNEKVFARVLAVAWEWTSVDRLPETIEQVRQLYEQTSQGLDPELSHCQPFPEIGAAVQAFVSSREARPGIYVFFDVGGGTLDGVAFNFRRDDGLPVVDFYSGSVEPLGIQALAMKVWSPLVPSAVQQMVERLLSPDRAEIPYREEIAGEIRRLVGRIVMGAKRKDTRDWRKDLIQASNIQKPYYYPVEDEDIRPLVVFTGGGGHRSEFYCDAIASTYEKFKHRNAGVPPYALTSVPKPIDLKLGGIPEEDFNRFLIAYGLSIPFGEGAEVHLPRDFEDLPPQTGRKRWAEFDYLDSKDMFD